MLCPFNIRIRGGLDFQNNEMFLVKFVRLACFAPITLRKMYIVFNILCLLNVTNDANQLINMAHTVGKYGAVGLVLRGHH